MRKLSISVAMMLAFMTMPTVSQCAETVHLFLKANGQEIKGESTQTSLGRQDSIQCIAYEQGVTTQRESATGMATGRRQYAPIVCRKRVDKSSPLLLKALIANQKIDAVFRFYRPNPKGDGTIEQFYTVEIKGASMASLKEFVLDPMVPPNAQEPALEEITLTGGSITWTYVNGGITTGDNTDLR